MTTSRSCGSRSGGRPAHHRVDRTHRGGRAGTDTRATMRLGKSNRSSSMYGGRPPATTASRPRSATASSRSRSIRASFVQSADDLLTSRGQATALSTPRPTGAAGAQGASNGSTSAATSSIAAWYCSGTRPTRPARSTSTSHERWRSSPSTLIPTTGCQGDSRRARVPRAGHRGHAVTTTVRRRRVVSSAHVPSATAAIASTSRSGKPCPLRSGPHGVSARSTESATRSSPWPSRSRRYVYGRLDRFEAS